MPAFSGSLWLSTGTLLKVIEEIADGIATAGFRRLVLLSCHGGNMALLEIAARDLRLKTGLMAFTIFPPALADDPVSVSPQERSFGIHANDWETSVMLALSPERVRTEQLDASYPGFQSDCLRLEFSAANVAWISKDLTRTGTLGDARRATAANGEARLALMVDRLTKVLTEISAFEMPGPAD
jgi:creatinine amidohydrolase